MDSEQTAREQSTPGNFNFLERLRGRNFPTKVVDFYLDERVGLALAEAEATAAVTTDPKRLKKLEETIAELRESAADSLYQLHLTGISNEKYEALSKEAHEAYPAEFEDVTNPFTGVKTRVEKENDDRDRMFTNMLWAAIITKVVDPNGDEDTDVTPELCANLRAVGPIDGLRRVSEAIDFLRGTQQWMDHIQSDDFFHKP